MTSKIENLTDKPLWLRLNSGASLAIAARAFSGEVPAHEIDGNAQLAKLLERGTIARCTDAAQEAADAKGERGKARRSAGAE
jgi:hypothetical protein